MRRLLSFNLSRAQTTLLFYGYFYRIRRLRTLRPLKAHCKLKIIHTPCFIDIFQWIMFMSNRLAKTAPDIQWLC